MSEANVRRLRVLATLVAAVALAGCVGNVLYRFARGRFVVPAPSIEERVVVEGAAVRIHVPRHVMVGQIVAFDDGLFAYLMFDHIRSRSLLRGKTVMLVTGEEGERPLYRILVQLGDDQAQGIELLADLRARNIASAVRFDWVQPSILEAWSRQTSVFVEAYNKPVTWRLKNLHATQLQAYLRRFIRFKSETDPRIARRIEPVPSPLSREGASQLAADIIAVARFYDIPIDLFLGIGAMENNYMNVRGDLKNRAWKRAPEPGDIVVRRRAGRVLVQNDSIGVWQITRESLRYAHQLYLHDGRDYSELPMRLRPPRKLDVNAVDNDVLTTYSGLLLRDLLDRFHGDVSLAAGAYNGGPTNPNARYAEGVEMVANYARRIIGRAAEIDGIAVENTTGTVPARRHP